MTLSLYRLYFSFHWWQPLEKLNNRKSIAILKPQRFSFAGKRGLCVVEQMRGIEKRVLSFKVVLHECFQLDWRNYPR